MEQPRLKPRQGATSDDSSTAAGYIIKTPDKNVGGTTKKHQFTFLEISLGELTLASLGNSETKMYASTMSCFDNLSMTLYINQVFYLLKKC
jgi:hypothetical protein